LILDRVEVVNADYVPSNFMGVKPRVLNSSGTVVIESDWYYNLSSAYAITYSVTENNASGARYAQGLQKTWTGSTWWTHNTFATASSSTYN
jgi:hypothetical protein